MPYYLNFLAVNLRASRLNSCAAQFCLLKELLAQRSRGRALCPSCEPGYSRQTIWCRSIGEPTLLKNPAKTSHFTLRGIVEKNPRDVDPLFATNPPLLDT